MRSAGWPFRAAAAVMGVLLTFAAIVQANDPDPVQWMGLYGVAAALSFHAAAATRRPLPAIVPGLVGAGALVWAAFLVPAVLGNALGPLELFRTYEMMSPQMEQGRELLGLLLVAGWLAVVAARGSWLRRS